MNGTTELIESERITPETIAAELRDLMSLLDLQTTVEVAALLRNPGDHYPSDGLIRTMLLARQTPSAKFVRLLRARRKEIDLQLKAGVYAIELAGRVRGVYQITPKRHLIPVLKQGDIESEGISAEDIVSASAIIAASLSVPHEWVGECQICGRPFLRRSSRSRYCYRLNERGVNECRREAARRARQAKRGASHASTGVSEGRALYLSLFIEEVQGGEDGRPPGARGRDRIRLSPLQLP